MTVDVADTQWARRVLSDDGRSALFFDARTANSFADTPVSDAELAEIWELAKWPPTSANTQPLRVLYVRAEEGKRRLVQHMNDGNKEKTLSAPAVAVLAFDAGYHEHIPAVFPLKPELKEVLAANAEMHSNTGRFSATLQAGYFILAVRAVGLVAGPMGGFDREGVDAEFFAENRWKSLLVVNIGHPGDNPWFDRLPRLEDDQVIQWA